MPHPNLFTVFGNKKRTYVCLDLINIPICDTITTIDNNSENNEGIEIMGNTVWKDRKRTIFGLPLSFTRYSLTDEKLLIDTGFFSRSEEEVRLYRVMDVTLRRTLRDRIFGVGTIHCCSADKSTPEFDIKRVKNASEIKNMISDMVESERLKKRITGREFMGGDDDDDDNDDEHDNII